jgi:alpha-L-arabinofuranosidase
VNITSSPMPLTIHLVGVNHLFGGVSDVIAGEPDAQNTIQHPRNVYPVVTRLAEKSPIFVHRFPAHSITVLRLKTHK